MILKYMKTLEIYDYTSGCSLDYLYLKNYYKMIAIYLSKQQALDTDPRAIQHISFTANYIKEEKQQYFSLLEKKKSCLRLFIRSCKRFVNVLKI